MCEWLLNVKARMVEMAVVVSDREKKAMADMKRFYTGLLKLRPLLKGKWCWSGSRAFVVKWVTRGRDLTR